MSYNYRHRIGEYSRENSNLFVECNDDRGLDGEREGQITALSKKNIYVMEHLATFTVNKDAGIVNPLDGMRRLLQMEKNTGIWSQKMKLRLDSDCILITDFETEDLIESFPATLIHCPTAFTSDDVMELYNNVLVFIVSAGISNQSEMHIFQSQSISAMNLVQDIKNLKKNDLPPNSSILTSQQHSNEQFAIDYKNTDGEFQIHHKCQRCLGKGNNKCGEHVDDSDNDFFGKDLKGVYGVRSPCISENEFGDTGPKFLEDTSSVSSENYEREVNLLNNCFDDIEKFIARLQHTAAAVRELERRRHKKREIGDGLINLHTRPPMQNDFLEILAKFKLSFNLLSKLKTHIHDPNAPELIHFLFTPLALIVEAARDTYTDSQLATKVIDPLLTRETVSFLINCVSSKETELWKSLGASWTIPEDEWCKKRDFYRTELLDGYLQDNAIINNLAISRPEEHALDNNSNRHAVCMKDISKIPFSCLNTSVSSKYSNFTVESQELDILQGEKRDFNPMSQDNLGEDHRKSEVHEEKPGFERLNANKVQPSFFNIGDKIVQPSLKKASIDKSAGMVRRINTYAEQWTNELRIRGANAVVVCYPRTANNDKELSVEKGEYLEVLDDSRKWWKVRNMHGDVAHVPSTIVAPVDYVNDNSKALKTYDTFTQNKCC